MALRTRVSMSAMGSLVIVLSYQLALITPGISPFSASWRKQIRQIPNLRRKPRGRPHLQHRLRCRHLYFGVLRSFAILAVVAIPLLCFPYCRNGMPRLLNKVNASASVLAV